ncbi:hypothetical protein VIGAN_09187900, partial [Vigna angularis var. angularis]
DFWLTAQAPSSPNPIASPIPLSPIQAHSALTSARLCRIWHRPTATPCPSSTRLEPPHEARRTFDSDFPSSASPLPRDSAAPLCHSPAFDPSSGAFSPVPPPCCPPLSPRKPRDPSFRNHRPQQHHELLHSKSVE